MLIDFLNLKKRIQVLYETNNITEKSEIDWLFCFVLKCRGAELLLKTTVSKKEYKKILKIAKIRITGKPLDKIIKERNFYGLNFKVNKNVLTPRQETELLVEQIIKDFKDVSDKKILDLGTGSGAIAITLKKHLDMTVYASDISSSALRVAKHNAKNHNTQINFIKSNLFEKINETFDAIVSNPPYIKSSDIPNLDKEVKDYDPILALDGGTIGLSFYKQIIKYAPQKLNKNGKLYLELGVGEYEAVSKMLNKNFTNTVVIKDYNNIERIIYAVKK